ncbi:MAG: hypothetical protein LBK12_03515 [Odoribacteraceae bacterium]|jgi:hypothetical protein|nr:hypothetical protein [Odoribacteraceae bacterium]
MKTCTVAVFIILLSACLQNREVRLSGRVEGKDSVILVRLNDQEYRLRVDANHSFSGNIPLQENAYAYAQFLPSRRRILLYLSPREHLEIIMTSPTPLFAGSLATINSYLIEQGEYFPLDAAALSRDEETFVKGAEELCRVRTLLLEAKNLGREFTAIESKRIGYLTAEYAMRYAMFTRSRLPDAARQVYHLGPYLGDFLSRFPVDDEKLADVNAFQQFVLAYYTFESETNEDIRSVMADVQERVKTQKTKDYLLSELASHHIFKQGLRDGSYLLSLCWREVKDTSRIMRVERVADRWRKLSAGTTAPDITLRDASGADTRLQEMRGDYLYIVASDARADAWLKDSCSFRAIKARYAGKNIRFLFLAFEPTMTLEHWQSASERIPWEHFTIVNWRNFHASYIISAFPRYFLIDPRGRFVTAVAPPPTRAAEGLFANVGL